jgi:CheY-like chemotaxis protein
MKTQTVLVVDDEYLIRWAISHALSDAGYEVSTAENGQKAIALTAGVRFDWVITDLEMPGVGGWELLDTLLQLKTPPRVIVTTARHEESNGQRVKEKGGWAYVEKSSRLIDGIKETMGAASAA